MRVSGAQGMATAGMDLWAIQLLGRWGSTAVHGYVREAHLNRAEKWARTINEHLSVDSMAKELKERVSKDLKG